MPRDKQNGVVVLSCTVEEWRALLAAVGATTAGRYDAAAMSSLVGKVERIEVERQKRDGG